jgi:hypothetical protein
MNFAFLLSKIMKRHLLFLALFCFFLNAIASDHYIVQRRDNINYITHQVKSGETLFQLSRDFSLKPAVLAKFNNVNYQTNLKTNQLIDIPLTETNFFRMAGLSYTSGFEPVYVEARNSKSDILKMFQISESTFNLWNPSNANTIREGSKVIIGWLKYSSNSSSSNQNLVAVKPTSKQEIIEPIEEESETKNESDITISSEPTSNTESIKKDKVNEAKPTKSPIYQTNESTPIVAQHLNPRYIDPNLPVNKSKPTPPTRKLYPRPPVYSKPAPQPVRKEVESIQDDSKDMWAKIKGIFKQSEKTKSSVAKNTTTESKKSIEPSIEVTKSTTQKSSLPTKVYPKTIPAKPTPRLNNNRTSLALGNKSPKVKEPIVKDPIVKDPKVEEPKKKEQKFKKGWSEFVSSFKSKKEKNNKNHIETATPKVVKNDPNRLYGQKPESKAKVVWNDFKNSFKPAKTNSKPVAKPTTSFKPVATVSKTPKTTSTKTASNTSINTKPKESTKPLEVVKVEEKKEFDPTVRNEIKTIALNNSKIGRASYFFSGPNGAKFYVATNLAPIGQIMKVINPDNGKYVMAEVMTTLPNADISKGLILKLSDNAKMPLGQKGSSFSVKVNY